MARQITTLTAACGLVLVASFGTPPMHAMGDEATKPAQCTKDDKPVDYARKADLPQGVIEALGLPMAEVGEPFQVTDVIVTKGLPFQRFISARQTGCKLKLNFERGGIAHRYESVELKLKNGKWTVDKP